MDDAALKAALCARDDIAPVQQQLLMGYMELLLRWNRTYNLVGFKQADVLVRDVLQDAEALLPYLAPAARVADVGSGAGLPGMVLALLRPDLHITLIDSNAKKTRFLRHVTAHMDLERVQIEHQRVQDVAVGVDVIVTKAFASLTDTVRACEHLLPAGSTLLALKGPRAAAEIAPIDHTRWRAEILPTAHPSRVIVRVTGSDS